MKKANCSLYETFNYGIQISLLLVTPQTTATTPNGCPKPLPRPTIRQLRTLDVGTQPHQCQGRKQTGRFVSQDVIGLVGGLKTPDARAIEKLTVAIFEVELKNESK